MLTIQRCDSSRSSRRLLGSVLVVMFLWRVPANGASPSGESSTENGRRLFHRLCAPCHGDKGNGNGMRSAPPRNLQDRAWRLTHSAEDIFNAIRDGVAGTSMPSWRYLSDANIRDLVAFILTLPQQPVEPQQTRVSQSPLEDDGVSRPVTRVTPNREPGHPDRCGPASTLKSQG
jgi:mono/diheme cytochrome c family protein